MITLYRDYPKALAIPKKSFHKEHDIDLEDVNHRTAKPTNADRKKLHSEGEGVKIEFIILTMQLKILIL